jgi:hypothetical protein
MGEVIRATQMHVAPAKLNHSNIGVLQTTVAELVTSEKHQRESIAMAPRRLDTDLDSPRIFDHAFRLVFRVRRSLDQTWYPPLTASVAPSSARRLAVFSRAPPSHYLHGSRALFSRPIRTCFRTWSALL